MRGQGQVRFLSRRLLPDEGIYQKLMGGAGPGRRIILPAVEQTIGRTHRIDVADRSRLLDVGVHKRSVPQGRREFFPKGSQNHTRSFGNISIVLAVAVIWIWIGPVFDRLSQRAEIEFEKRKQIVGGRVVFVARPVVAIEKPDDAAGIGLLLRVYAPVFFE